MDPSKLIPAGSVRLHAVLTLKEKGDVAKIKEDLKKVFAATHNLGGKNVLPQHGNFYFWVINAILCIH